MATYTYSCCVTFDQRTSFEAKVPCPSCGKDAQRESVYAVSVSGFVPTPNDQIDFSRDYKAYNEASQEIVYKSDRAGVDPPPLAQMAKKKATQLAKAGVTASDL